MSAGGYFDVDEILAADERVKCTFQVPAMGCGYLDASCTEPDLDQGANVELPLWLVEYLTRTDNVLPEPPHYLTIRFRRMLQAGPSSVNLREFSAYFFEVGRQLLPLVDKTKAKDIDEILRLAFGGERYRAVLNNAMSSLDEDTTEFTRKLTQSEKQLFQAGARDAKDFLNWKGRNAETISTAAVVQRSIKKRKFRT